MLARLALRLGLSPIPLYLVAGLAFGRGGVVPLVTAEGFIQAGAQIGLILLLFSLGLEYSAQELLRTIRTNASGGAVDAVLNFAPGLLMGLILGWGWLPAVFLGGVTYISSSGVIARLLDELGWIANRETPGVLALLVIEDLVMAVFLPVVGILLVGGGVGRAAGGIVLAFLVVAAVLAIAARYGDPISRVVFRASDEALLLAIVGFVLVIAGVTELLNISAAVGAFLAGILVSGSAADRARALLRPLRDLFAGVFFVFFGFEIDPAAIPSSAVAAVSLAAVGAGTKYLTGWWGARRSGSGPRGRRRAGILLIARGEFSIVIAGLGVAGGLEGRLGPVAATYVLLLAVAGPVAARLVQRSERTTG